MRSRPDPAGAAGAGSRSSGLNRRFFRATQWLLGGIICVFIMATFSASILDHERRAAMAKSARFNTAWLVSQSAIELDRFAERVSAFEAGAPDVDADEVRLRFDILQNRLGIYKDSQLRSFLASSPDYLSIAQDFERTVGALAPLVSRLEQPGATTSIRALASPLGGRLAQLAAAAFQHGVDLDAADQRDLVALHWKFSVLVVGLVCCGVSFVVLLIWRNRQLATAHRELNVLAEDLGRASGHLNAAMDNMGQGLCLVDGHQRLVVCNRQFLNLFSLSAETAAPGRPLAEILAAAGPHLADSGPDAARQLGASSVEAAEGSFVLDLKNGSTIAVSRRSLHEGGWVATYQDVSERRRAEARISYLAHHDALTGLPNRAWFLQRLDEAFRGPHEQVAVLSLDLDRFKAVNDTLGHPRGDRLLCDVAQRLRHCLGSDDIVARFGGDEFAVLQVGQAQPEAAEGLARRLTEVIATPYSLEDNEAVIGVSIGIAVAENDNVDELLKHSDLALYRAKGEGRGTHRVFESRMDREMQARRVLELDLRQAVVDREFEVHYQPIVDLTTYAIVGYEALLRWNNPRAGLVSPAVFIPVAEEIGLIATIGAWVIEKACADAATWPAGMRVAVNLSPAQFKNRGVIDAIVSALGSSGLPPQRLELEITESVLLQSNDATLAMLHDIRRIGCSIALDDFGTGFSSLSYLRNFPFDKIKIDRSFVRDSDRPDCIVIVQSVASLADKLDMLTTAEGIETLEQLEKVRDAGCSQGQGFLFAVPKPVGELTHVLPSSVSGLGDPAPAQAGEGPVPSALRRKRDANRTRSVA